MIVADATPLIVLAKLDRLAPVKHGYGGGVAPAVYGRVVHQGLAKGALEVIFIQRAVEEGWMQRVQLTGGEQRLAEGLVVHGRLDRGEAELLAMARTRGLRLVLDDKEGRVVAGALGVHYLGTVGVMLEAYGKGRLSNGEVEGVLGDLAKVLWIAPEVFTEALERARRIRR